MAGVKGRSGGARPGAGRKPKPPPVPVRVEGEDTLKLLQDIAFGRIDATPLQVRAAIAAVQYTHAKVGGGGKKEARDEGAKRVAQGKFAPAATPRLAVSGGKAVQ